jgi:hypothetical protein
MGGMKTSIITFSTIALLSLSACNRESTSVSATSTQLSFNLPVDWFKTGSEPESYEMGIDKGAGQDGKNSATIKSIQKKINGFGALMQNCAPDKYLGKKIRMTALVKSKEIADWAGLWLRVDKQGSQTPLSFDNMQDRAIKGTTDWKRYEIVLNVPANASLLAFGALVHGTGQLWFDDMTFEVAGDSVPSNGKSEKDLSTLGEPANLDFEK